MRGCVRGRLGRVLRATPESLPKRVREALPEDPDGLPAHVERLLIVLETISRQIADADEELRLLAEADVRMARLKSVPGDRPTNEYIFAPRAFTELQNAQAIMLPYDGMNPLPPQLCYLKPHYLDV